MTNKEKLKNVINKDINKIKNYNLVINNIDKGFPITSELLIIIIFFPFTL